MKKSFSSTGTQPASSFNYGYVIVAAAFVIVMMNVGMYLSMGVFFKPISEQMHWTRGDTALPIALSTIVTAFLNIAAGNWVDRYGPRKIAMIFVLISGAGYLLMSRMSSMWEFYLYFGLLAAVGASLMSPFLSLIPRWFTNRRTVMSGIIAAGGGVGGLFLPLISDWLITNYSWQRAYLVLGIVFLVLTLAAVFFLRASPTLAQASAASVARGNPPASGLNLKEVLHTRNFWLIALMVFTFGLVANTINMHSAINATDQGISSTAAAGLLSIMNGVSIFGCVVLGAMGDKFGNRRMIILNFIFVGLSLIWLAFTHQLWMMNVFMVVYGVFFGSGLAQTPALVGRLFGIRSLGLILGTINFIQTMGAATGSYLPGWIYDINKNYFMAFIICGVMCGLAVIAMFLLKVKTAPGD
jgi:MFS family permease